MLSSKPIPKPSIFPSKFTRVPSSCLSKVRNHTPMQEISLLLNLQATFKTSPSSSKCLSSANTRCFIRFLKAVLLKIGRNKNPTTEPLQTKTTFLNNLEGTQSTQHSTKQTAMSTKGLLSRKAREDSLLRRQIANASLLITKTTTCSNKLVNSSSSFSRLAWLMFGQH